MCPNSTGAASRRYGLLTDAATIRRRVFAGDHSFAMRVVLTALIKCDHELRAQIFAELLPEDFSLPAFDLLFERIRDQLQHGDTVDRNDLERRMEAHVRSLWPSAADRTGEASQRCAEDVMHGFFAPIEHVFAIEAPDADLIHQAIRVLKHMREARQRAWPSHQEGRTRTGGGDCTVCD